MIIIIVVIIIRTTRSSGLSSAQARSTSPISKIMMIVI